MQDERELTVELERERGGEEIAPALGLDGMDELTV